MEEFLTLYGSDLKHENKILLKKKHSSAVIYMFNTCLCYTNSFYLALDNFQPLSINIKALTLCCKLGSLR